jgi:hypothetical protein
LRRSTWRGSPAKGCAVERGEIAEHPGRHLVLATPGQQLEGAGVGAGEHVALLDAAEAVDGRAVELHALVERVLELRGGDGERLQLPEHVGEPEAYEAHPALLDGAQHVLLLAIHVGHRGARDREQATRIRLDSRCVHTANRPR